MLFPCFSLKIQHYNAKYTHWEPNQGKNYISDKNSLLVATDEFRDLLSYEKFFSLPIQVTLESTRGPRTCNTTSSLNHRHNTQILIATPFFLILIPQTNSQAPL